MKTIEGRANNAWFDYQYTGGPTFERIFKDGFKAGAESERDRLTKWRDPKEELPEDGKCVLIRAVDQLDNEALYMGSWEGDRYITDLGLAFGNDFDDESVPDMNIKAIGWRPIHE